LLLTVQAESKRQDIWRQISLIDPAWASAHGTDDAVTLAAECNRAVATLGGEGGMLAHMRRLRAASGGQRYE
jgi:hypothetical protein